MPIRRRVDPIYVHHIWDAIKQLTYQRLPSEQDRIVKQLCRGSGYSYKEWEKTLKEALGDKLIETALRRDDKTQVYKLPTAEMPVLDGRDWYCFECHQAGDVIFCKNKLCHRVFHKTCVTDSAIENYQLFKNLFSNSDSTVFLKKGQLNRRKSMTLDVDGIEIVESNRGGQELKSTYNNNLCIVCNMMTLKDFSLEKSELNYLFKFALHRIRSWIPSNVTHKMDGSHDCKSWQSQADLDLRANHLFFEHMDMSEMELKINNSSYTSCHKFLIDVLTINHNIGIFHGLESQEFAATDFILRDSLHDLGEIIGCADCYKHSNEKINVNWFTLPCTPPHEIVWAKQKGYNYWPAKVVKESHTHYDVRFFGSKHERALLTKEFVKPITRTKESLKVKNSATLLKAIEELELHQKLSQNPSALKAFIATSKKRITLPKQWKSPVPSPKKSRNSKAPKISSIEDDGDEKPKPTSRKRARSTISAKSKKEYIPITELPFLSDKPTKKRGTQSMPVKQDRQSPEIGSAVLDIPVKKRKGRLSAKDPESTEISSEVLDIPLKKRRGRVSTKVNQQQKRNPTRKTRSVSKIKEKPQECTDTVMDTPDVIHISDTEDNITLPFNGNPHMTSMEYQGHFEQLEQVTSSTEFRAPELTPLRSQEMQPLDQPFSDEVEMMRRTLEGLPNKKEVIKSAMDCMQKEIDRITEKHNDHLRRLFDSHNAQISETKKKQWCYYCEQDAIYHCCWNTAYCSTMCQQQHWQAEHKQVCRRKR